MTKTVLITGTSGGIGLEFARIFARNGYDMVIVARSVDKLESIKEEFESQYGIRVYVCPQDLSILNASSNIYAYTQAHNIHIDILVNNAGFGDYGPFITSNWSKQESMVTTNITSLMQLCHLYIPKMVEKGFGKVINVSSVASFLPGPRMSVYYATKAFVTSFSEALAEELKDTGVSVTILCPGPVKTGFKDAADMKEAKMFSMFGKSAKDVAMYGYKGMQKGKELVCAGLSISFANIGTRLITRKLARKIAQAINQQ